MTFTDQLANPFLWLSLANSIATLLLYLRKPGEESKVAIAALSARLDVIEERVKHMPTDGELKELEGTVRSVVAALEGVKASHDAVRVTLVRVENYLLTHKG